MKTVNNIKSLILFFVVATLLMSCEKEISIDLGTVEPQIVIEGNITDAPGPYYIRISRTVNFSSQNNFPTVSNALVIISDDKGVSDTLTETVPGVYKTRTIEGVPENTYFLNVSTEGRNYHSSSTMPKRVNLDSLIFNPLIFSSQKDLYYTVPIYTDPIEPGNYYRFYLFVNGKKDNSYSVFNDNLNNGLVNGRPLFGRDTEIKSGDTVTVEMHCIDKNIYNYLFALSQLSSGRPGGVTPSNPTTNISGDYALGYFSAHTIQQVVGTPPK